MSPRKKKKVTKKRKKSVKKSIAREQSKKVLPEESLVKPGPWVDELEEHYLVSWMAPEFVYHEKPVWWHWVAYSFVAVLVILMIILQEWFGLVVFVLLGVLIYQYAEVKPKNIEIALTTIGVKVGKKFYPYNSIRAFWVLYNPSVRTLNLELTKRFSPVISIQLEEIDPVSVKEILGEHCHEEFERTEDIIEKLTRIIRF